MSADWKTIRGEDVNSLRIRKLVGVRLVRVFDWEDGDI